LYVYVGMTDFVAGRVTAQFGGDFYVVARNENDELQILLIVLFSWTWPDIAVNKSLSNINKSKSHLP
jgi:hypothetical protein